MIDAIPWDGQKITKPGIYSGVPMEVYHSDCCAGPSISSSGLRLLDSRSPAHYWAQSYLNPNREPEEPKEAFSFGQAAHALLLGESGFREKFAVRPEHWSDWRTSAAKEWREAEQAAGRTIITPDDVARIKAIAENLSREPLVQSGFLRGHVERSLFWKDERTGMWLKARPDVIPHADAVVVDIKTTTDASPDRIQRAVLDHGYALQGSLIGAGLRSVLGITMTEFVLVWVEKASPFAVNISPVDPEWIGWAGRQVRRAIDTFARCIETGQWQSYQSDLTTSMPSWLRTRLEAEVKYGMLPDSGILDRMEAAE